MSLSAVKQQLEQFRNEIKDKDPRNISQEERGSILDSLWKIQSKINMNRPHDWDFYANASNNEIYESASELGLPFQSRQFHCTALRNGVNIGQTIVNLNLSSTIGELKKAAAKNLNIPLETIKKCTTAFHGIFGHGETFPDNTALTDPKIINGFSYHSYAFFNLDLT